MARRFSPSRGIIFFSILFFWLLPAGLACAAIKNGPLQVKVEGLNKELRLNVEAALVIPPGLVRDGKIEPRWLDRFTRQVPSLVSGALKPYGYYNSTTATRVEQVNGKGKTRLIVTVSKGEPVLTENVEVLLEGPGAGEAPLLALVRAFPVVPGKVLRQDHYEQAKGALLARSIDLGYLDAEFADQEILLDPLKNRADVTLLLETGPRFYFGEVHIEGAPEYPERFLQRFLAFGPNRPFVYAKLGQTQLNFLNSDRFRDVVVSPRMEDAQGGRVPTAIRLTPSARRRLRPGVGYGTDTGPRFSLRYKDVNLFRLGHEFSTDLMVAQKRQELSSAYIIPGYRNINSQTALKLGLQREDPGTYQSQSISAELERIRSFGKGKQGSVFLRLLQEESEVAGEDKFRSRMVIPGVRYSRRRLDDDLRPRKGYQYGLEMRGAHQSLGSDTGLLQAVASGNTVASLPGKLLLITRLQAGWTWQNEPLTEVPVSLRFFAGGDQSVRGYAYQALGPRDDSGQVAGGKHLLIGSLELERSLGENWAVAAFYDAGNAFDSLSDYELFEGAGIGVRRYTPVGPIKLDVARTLGDPDPSYRFHISIGLGW